MQRQRPEDADEPIGDACEPGGGSRLPRVGAVEDHGRQLNDRRGCLAEITLEIAELTASDRRRDRIGAPRSDRGTPVSEARPPCRRAASACGHRMIDRGAAINRLDGFRPPGEPCLSRRRLAHHIADAGDLVAEGIEPPKVGAHMHREQTGWRDSGPDRAGAGVRGNIRRQPQSAPPVKAPQAERPPPAGSPPAGCCRCARRRRCPSFQSRCSRPVRRSRTGPGAKAIVAPVPNSNSAISRALGQDLVQVVDAHLAQAVAAASRTCRWARISSEPLMLHAGEAEAAAAVCRRSARARDSGAGQIRLLRHRQVSGTGLFSRPAPLREPSRAGSAPAPPQRSTNRCRRSRRRSW